ncbi:MAG: MurR/RpiR family transcriptional regulator, partial [Paenibacillaceae bacterium]|nr:MurR/RpiR family transcriptional regulator [Paenibacillaceae bacterium]
MVTDVIAAIYSRSGDLTKNERKVADYVLQQPVEVLHMTITDLADRCGVADSTVFRFCKTVGATGYQQFKVLLAQSVGAGQQSGVALDDVDPKQSLFETGREIKDRVIDAVELTFKSLHYEDLNRAVDLIAGARKLYFFGVGSSGTLAQQAFQRFIRINPEARHIADAV